MRHDTGNDAIGGTSFADAKKTIQAAVNQVSPGGTVHVKDGVYNEAITVSKPLTLEGHQHGVLAKGRPGPEAIIQLTTNQTPLTLNASNVTVDGFTLLKIEGMAWADATTFYLAIDKKLYRLTVPAVGSATLTTYATNLPSGTESLDIRADGKLVGGNKSAPLKYFVYKIATKTLESTVTVKGVSPFKPKSIEGLALAPAATQ